MNSLRSRLYSLLRASERHTETDMVKLASNSFWLAAGPAVGSITALGLSIAFANLISADAYGVYRYVLATAGILSIATLAGLNTAVMRAVAQGRDGVVPTALKKKIEWGLLGGFASLLIALYYHINGARELALAFALISPFIPLIDALHLYQAVLQGLGKFKLSAAYLAYSQVGAAIAILAAIVLSGNPIVIILTYFASWTFARSVAYLIVRRSLRSGSRADSDDLKYGKHLSLMGALDVVATQADKLLIFQTLGAPSLAGYALALAIPDQLKSLLKNVLTVSFPGFSVSSADTVRGKIRRASLYLLLPLLLFTLLYVVIAPFLFSLLLPDYVSFVLFSQVYALVLVLVPKALHRIFLESHSATKELYGFQLFSFVLKISLLFSLTTLFGIWGAVAALLLTELGIYLYLEWRIRFVS